MTCRSWVTALPIRIVFGIALVFVVIGTHMAVAKPRLPFVLLDSFDKAMSLVEKQVAELESAKPRAQTRPTLHAALTTVLDHMDGEVSVACDAATVALDGQLAALAQLAPERRIAALEVTTKHLVDARAKLVRATDPAEYAEYDALCERLREVRRLLA